MTRTQRIARHLRIGDDALAYCIMRDPKPILRLCKDAGEYPPGCPGCGNPVDECICDDIADAGGG